MAVPSSVSCFKESGMTQPYRVLPATPCNGCGVCSMPPSPGKGASNQNCSADMLTCTPQQRRARRDVSTGFQNSKQVSPLCHCQQIPHVDNGRRGPTLKTTGKIGHIKRPNASASRKPKTLVSTHGGIKCFSLSPVEFAWAFLDKSSVLQAMPWDGRSMN